MIRLLIFLVVIAAAAWGLMWFSDNPGIVDITWRGVEYRFSLMLLLEAIIVLAVLISVVWAILRFVFNLPSLARIGARSRRRDRGLKALSRGLVAVNAGDARAAAKYAAEASRHAEREPLTRLLRAQSAQLSGDQQGAIAAYKAMLDHPDTIGIGLRGLHHEARRSGDERRGAAICGARQRPDADRLVGSGRARRPRAARRLGRRARDHRHQRRRPADRQADGGPLARRRQDGDGRGAGGARLEAGARAGAGGHAARAGPRSRRRACRPADRRRPATSAAQAASSNRPMR